MDFESWQYPAPIPSYALESSSGESELDDDELSAHTRLSSGGKKTLVPEPAIELSGPVERLQKGGEAIFLVGEAGERIAQGVDDGGDEVVITVDGEQVRWPAKLPNSLLRLTVDLTGRPYRCGRKRRRPRLPLDGPPSRLAPPAREQDLRRASACQLDDRGVLPLAFVHPACRLSLDPFGTSPLPRLDFICSAHLKAQVRRRSTPFQSAKPPSWPPLRPLDRRSPLRRLQILDSPPYPDNGLASTAERPLLARFTNHSKRGSVAVRCGRTHRTRRPLCLVPRAGRDWTTRERDGWCGCEQGASTGCQGGARMDLVGADEAGRAGLRLAGEAAQGAAAGGALEHVHVKKRFGPANQVGRDRRAWNAGVLSSLR